MAKKEVVREALIEKFEEGVSNKELLKKYSNTFRNVADMYSQFRSYLFALAKTHPEETLKLLKSKKDIVVKSIARSLKYDLEKRLAITKSVLEGALYDAVAEKHSLSIARTRGIFMEVINEISKKYSLGIPHSFGKKQIISEYKTGLIKVIDKMTKNEPVKKGYLKKSSKKIIKKVLQ